MTVPGRRPFRSASSSASPIARALLEQPDWLLVDEATAAMDEPTEAAIYRVLREELPSTTLVSIGHRSTLVAFHERRIDMVQGRGRCLPARRYNADSGAMRRSGAFRRSAQKIGISNLTKALPAAYFCGSARYPFGNLRFLP